MKKCILLLIVYIVVHERATVCMYVCYNTYVYAITSSMHCCLGNRIYLTKLKNNIILKLYRYIFQERNLFHVNTVVKLLHIDNIWNHTQGFTPVSIYTEEYSCHQCYFFVIVILPEILSKYLFFSLKRMLL